MKLSKLALEIAESPTLALNEEARLLRERGEAVINLGIGEPKNKTPIAAILASGAKLSSGEVKYTPPDGLPSMKKAVIRYTEENYNRLVAPENVIITNGAKQSLFNIFYSILNPQDEVIIIAPFWVSYPEMIKMCLGVPVVVTPEDGTFTPRFEDIERAITSSTRAIVVNSPNNPSGAIYPPELVEKIVELCERKGIFMICDDIYHKLVFGRNVAVPAYSFTKKEIDNSHIIVVNGVAKVYGMTGFRIGWVIAPRDLIKVMTNVLAQTTSCVSPIAQAAAEGALNGLQSVVEALRLQIQNNREVVLQEMRTFNGARLIEPKGTFYALLDLRAFNTNSVELSKFLLKKALVVTVPGREFGMEGHIRISFAGSIKDITEGIARIKWALDPTSPNEIYIGDKKMIRDWM
ncbi:MAG TPA: pyridoxal phosphate-dependent aminotransferase [Anaerolineales bacterium]|nr:pyridoxal phosphate-dependent aminotransferase [Anaerolineales bacterium]HMV96012.1 pyridoxal phosphate-dependent aminotransferase [Anaerolineales bacterium]HMX19783.1 pyridoxal phosphate-dependent aminotransferase [Anaerolineales bacterium]HMX74745.1 pyridoxal phosphate-dependent aminotransferase [Anaerolineales bacterium]HMZ43585.1 pyridoxal phosphate-dependent aminotransferase [Anaerolineales bacterium]